jgi:glycosyltransferase involved in cell wall biosynthesis
MQGELTMDATGLYERSSQQRRAWRQLLDAADVVTGCSQAVLDDAASEYAGAWQQRATVVPNGVRPTDFTTASHLQHPRPYVLGIGRMVPQKGFDVLIRAFASLATPADLDLILAGDGPSRAELEALVAQLDLTTRVRFLGPIGREDAAAAFRGASAFVLASRREPQGIVILEAMAAETPVVATRVGGVPETVAHEVNGLLVETGNIEQLARAIERLVSDSTLNLRIRREGLITAARHDWRAITSAYSEVYESARNTRLARRPQ